MIITAVNEECRATKVATTSVMTQPPSKYIYVTLFSRFLCSQDFKITYSELEVEITDIENSPKISGRYTCGISLKLLRHLVLELLHSQI